jgi:hypothetical protein
VADEVMSKQSAVIRYARVWRGGICGFAVLVSGMTIAIGHSTIGGAQQKPPSTHGLLRAEDLRYAGSFRVPQSQDFEFGGAPVTYNPANNSLFVGNWYAEGGTVNRIAEIAIPKLLGSDTALGGLPVAKMIQAFADPTEGHLRGSNIGGTPLPAMLSGLLVDGGNLYGSAYSYYDANNDVRVSHYVRAVDLGTKSFRGWYTLYSATQTGFVAGPMATVPMEWRTLLGGAALTGQCCVPIVTRTSYGPSAFAFTPSAITGTPYPNQPTPIPAVPLLEYPSAHRTLGAWEGQNTNYGMTTMIGGFVVVEGTRSLLYFGRNGTGAACYGDPTSDQALAGTKSPDGATYCFDPAVGGKGTHAFPYVLQVWAYDLGDLALVRAGKKKPWEPRPYATWPISFPPTPAVSEIGGVGYDSAHQLVYFLQRNADRSESGTRAVIHVIRVG